MIKNLGLLIATYQSFWETIFWQAIIILQRRKSSDFCLVAFYAIFGRIKNVVPLCSICSRTCRQSHTPLAWWFTFQAVTWIRDLSLSCKEKRTKTIIYSFLMSCHISVTPCASSWHSVRCMHAVIGKFTNTHFGILNKAEILGLKGLKVCP